MKSVQPTTWYQTFQNNPNHENDAIDYKRFFSLFFGNWYWFVIALFLTISIAYGINRWSEEVYTVSSTLLIKDDQFGNSTSTLANIFPGSELYSTQQNLNNEIGILKSYNLNYRAAQKLTDFDIEYISIGKRGIAESRLYKKSPFIVLYDSVQKQTTEKRVDVRITSDTTVLLKINDRSDFEKSVRIGDRFNERGFDFVIMPRNRKRFNYNRESSNKYYFYFTSVATLANRYRGKLSVTPIQENATLVTLSLTGFVPEQEADYLNSLMDVYRDFGLELKNETAGQTIDFIEEQIATIYDSLGLAEAELENFRLSNKLIDLSREGSLIQSRLEQVDAEKSGLVLQRNYYNYLVEYLNSKNETGDIVAPSVSGLTDQLLIGSVEELSQLQKQKAQVSMNLFESTEPLKIIEDNIVTTRKALAENIENGLNNINQSMADADSKLALIEGEVRKLPTTERQMINIQRKFDINNTVYTFLLEKRAEAGIAKASNVSDNVIIDRAGAYNSTRIRPKARQNYMMALIAGLLFPAICILLIDYLNNKIIDRKDIEKGTKAPIIGYISHNNLKSEIPVVEKPGSTLSESFRSVRTNLKYFVRDIQCPVISISSTITAEGKTFVSANLAAITAMLGKRVLLVGLDLRKPRTHKILGIENTTGLSGYLIGENSYEEIIRETEVKNLWYVPSGPVPPNPAELIDSPNMMEFLTRAKGEYDFIFIDTPPVAIVIDPLLLSGITDFYIFIIRQRYTSRDTLGLIDEMFKNENIKGLGIIMNDISQSGYYGYGLRYGGYFGYGYSYGYSYYNQYAYSRYGQGDSGADYYTDDEN